MGGARRGTRSISAGISPGGVSGGRSRRAGADATLIHRARRVRARTLPGEVFAKFQLEVEQEVHRQNTAADAKVPQQEEPAEVETSSAIVPRADPVGPSDKRAIEGWGLALLVILIGGTLAVPLAITIETAKDPNSQPEAVSVTTPPAPAVQPAPAPSFLTRFLTPNSLRCSRRNVSKR